MAGSRPLDENSNPFEYKALYKALAEDERLRLEEIQPLNGRPDVATGFLKSLDFFIALYREKARDLDVPLDDAFIDYMRAFADSEIEAVYPQRSRLDSRGRFWATCPATARSQGSPRRAGMRIGRVWVG